MTKEEIHPEAKIGKNVQIDAGCIIEKDVIVGNGTTIARGAIIKNGVEIGENNEIHSYAVIGDTPQDKSHHNNTGKVIIGNSNIIREFTTIHLPVGEKTETRIGDSNYLMAYSHVAHNCRIGNNVLLVNGATLGGFVEIEDFAYISAFVPVHQWVKIGAYSIIGGGLRIIKDLIPFAMAAGSPLRVISYNSRGLKRNGFSAGRIGEIKKAFRILFRSNLNTKQAVKKLKEEFEGNKDIEHIIKFISESKRGIVK
jgi:UDP-N-acetylglucosamine acyltransferase